MRRRRDGKVYGKPMTGRKYQSRNWHSSSTRRRDGKGALSRSLDTFPARSLKVLTFEVDIANRFHSENGILTMIFALCMWDIIFAPVDGVFETRFQSAPLDLSTDAFAIVREKRINKILAAIEAGKAGKFLEKADDRERERGTFCVGVRWNDYSKEDLLEIVDCLGGHAVAVICRVFSEEFNHRTGGIPDLCLWKPNQSEAMFVEVKGSILSSFLSRYFVF